MSVINNLSENEKYECILSLSWGHYDPSACISINGNIVAYVEEERLTRQKHAIGRFPDLALLEVLDIAGITILDVNLISVNWDLQKFESGYMEIFYDNYNAKYRPDGNTRRWQRNNLCHLNHEFIRNFLVGKFTELFGSSYVPEIVSFGHHYVHAWQASVMSGFDDSIVLVMDGSGDDLATSIWFWKDGSLRNIKEIYIPNSLGWFFAAVTEFLGFSAYDGEAKVMAMAGYGFNDLGLKCLFDRVLDVHDGEYSLNLDYIHNGLHTYSGRFTDKFFDEIGGGMPLDSNMEQRHFNIALAAQNKLFEAASALLRPVMNLYFSNNICLSGGVALNVSLSRRIQSELGFEKLFSNPLSSDAGAIVGASLLASSRVVGIEQRKKISHHLKNLSLGRCYSDAMIIDILHNKGYKKFYRIGGDYIPVAELLASGAILAWFQGGCEAGPRALGFRSLLCDPRNGRAIDKLTVEIKARQWWQPYGVSVIKEMCVDYFELDVFSPNMSTSVGVREIFRNIAPRAVHVDGSVRPHVVDDHFLSFYKLIRSFGDITGLYALINTSLNRKGEPIAYSPSDALEVYEGSSVDAIVIGDFLLQKEGRYGQSVHC